MMKPIDDRYVLEVVDEHYFFAAKPYGLIVLLDATLADGELTSARTTGPEPHPLLGQSAASAPSVE